MEKFINISSQHDNEEAVINDCVKQCQAAPPGANFGFIYATDDMSDAYPELLRQCKAATGIQHWIGSLGLGVITTNQELYDQPAASLMLAQFNENDFSMLPLTRQHKEIDAIIGSFNRYATHFGIIHGDPHNQETQNLIENLQKQLENGFLVGGLTSSRGYQLQVNDNVTYNGISGVLFSENVPVLTNLTQGCSPAGEKHRITRSRENSVFLLDDEPALQVLMDDMHLDSIDELERKANEVFVGLCIPGSDKNDYTVRNLVGADVRHDMFAINDYLIEGNEILFCERNEQTAIDDMQRMLDNLSRRVKQSSSQKIKGGLYVSCLGRGREQFGEHSEEIKMIHKTLGEFPLTGFFANGEIHHNRLYGYTGVLTLFV